MGEQPCQHPGCTTAMTSSAITGVTILNGRNGEGAPADRRGLPVIRGTSSGHVHMHDVVVLADVSPDRVRVLTDDEVIVKRRDLGTGFAYMGRDSDHSAGVRRLRDALDGA